MPITKQSSGATAGDIKPWPASTAPAGWIKCNGAAVSRTLYAALFNVIGTTYGAGDGSTTFNLPDLRGEFLRGLDDGRGVDTGRSIGTVQLDQLQGHVHQQQGANSAGGGYVYAGGGSTFWSGLYTNTPASDGTNGTPRTGAETRPRNQAALWIIKF